MSYVRRCKANSDIQTVRRKLSDGSVATYRYHRIARVRLLSEPGTPEFEAEVAAIINAAKIRPAEHVYFVQAVQLGLIKIGIANDIEARIRALHTACPDKLLVLGIIRRGGKPREEALHAMFAAHRSHGEWFRPAGELLAYIADHAEQYSRPNAKSANTA